MTTTITQEHTTYVHRAHADSAPALARTLACAFYDDPAFIHLWPNDATRLHQSRRYFAEIAQPATLPPGYSYMTPDRTGAALWLPPGPQEKPGLVDKLRLIRTVASISGRDAARVLRSFSFMDENHPHEPHYYLWLMGVDPEFQGQGIGSALMQPILHRADEEGMPAYVEATSERNRALYLRHGFEDMRTEHWPDGGPPLFLMWREPA